MATEFVECTHTTGVDVGYVMWEGQPTLVITFGLTCCGAMSDSYLIPACGLDDFIERLKAAKANAEAHLLRN